MSNNIICKCGKHWVLWDKLCPIHINDKPEGIKNLRKYLGLPINGNKKLPAASATDSSVHPIIPGPVKRTSIISDDTKKHPKVLSRLIPPNNDLREAIRVIWRPILDKTIHAQEMAYLISVCVDETEALLKADCQRLLEDIEIQHAKELEECIEFTTKDVLDKLLAELPKDGIVVEPDKEIGLGESVIDWAKTDARNKTLAQCRQIIKGMK